MKYFKQNDNIDPTIVNQNFSEIEILTARAAQFVKELSQRHTMTNMLLNNHSLIKTYDGALATAVIESMTGGTDYIYMPGITFMTGPTSMEHIQLENGYLSLAFQSETSRIASRTNKFQERIPSENTVYAADNSQTMVSPELIFSQDAAWAESLEASDVNITATFPPSLETKYNYVKMLPVLPDTSLELITPNLSPIVRNTIGHFPEGHFGSQLVVKSTGRGTGAGAFLHNAGLVDVGWRDFYEAGSVTKRITVNATEYASITSAELSIAFGLNYSRLGQIAQLKIKQFDAGNSLVGTVYDSDVDTYPLASSVAIDANTTSISVTVSLKRYANSSAIIKGVVLNLLRS